MSLDDDMQNFRQKTGRKSGCHGCKYADWDADGATCKLDGLNVLNPAKGCKYRKERSVTNGDMIRQMDDEQLIRYMIPYVCAMHHVRDCQNNCDDCAREWLKKEAET